MTKILNEREQKFVDVLFEEGIDGDISKAKLAAGYSQGTTNMSLATRLKDEILKAAENFLAVNSPRGVIELVKILDNPTELGNQNILAAAKEILDRAGVVKKDTVEIKADQNANILILIPGKEKVLIGEWPETLQDSSAETGVLQEQTPQTRLP